MDELKDLSLKKCLEIHNEITGEKVKKFSNRATANKKIKAALKETKDGIIRLLDPDYEKRGKAKDRWDILDDCLTVKRYLDLCEGIGHSRGEALRDLRYNEKHELIKVVRG